MNLRCVHRDGDHDEQAGAAKIKRNRVLGYQDFGEETNRHKVGGADDRQPCQHIVDVIGGVLARTDAGDEAAILTQVVGRLRRVEDDGGVEEAEEHDQRGVQQHIERRAVRDVARHRLQPLRSFAAGEADRGQRQQQQRRGEDRRNDAGRVHLQRQVRRFAAEHSVADLTLRILHQQAALGAFHEDDEEDDPDRHHQHQDDEDGGQRALAAEFQRVDQRARQFRDDAGEDDQRRAVADAAGGDLLTQPHQEHGAADQRDDRGDAEEQAGSMTAAPVEPRIDSSPTARP